MSYGTFKTLKPFVVFAGVAVILIPVLLFIIGAFIISPESTGSDTYWRTMFLFSSVTYATVLIGFFLKQNK